MTPARRDSPVRLWSLTDIMRTFTPKSLLDALARLELDRCHLKAEKREGGGGVPIDPGVLERVTDHFQQALIVCQSVELYTAHQQIELILVDVKGPRGTLGIVDVSTLLAYVGTVIHALTADLWKRQFVMVDTDYVSAIENENWLGETVATAFSTAKLDIREAGNCFAAECPTAAVFHLMRVMEWGLRALAADVGLLKVLKDRRKRKYVPLPWSEWEHILNQLSGKVDDKLAKMKPGPKKQEMQQFYYPAIQDIKGVRDAWRNHVMHTRSEYTLLDAKAIKDHVQRLMTNLATRVSEG